MHTNPFHEYALTIGTQDKVRLQFWSQLSLPLTVSLPPFFFSLILLIFHLFVQPLAVSLFSSFSAPYITLLLSPFSPFSPSSRINSGLRPVGCWWARFPDSRFWVWGGGWNTGWFCGPLDGEWHYHWQCLIPTGTSRAQNACNGPVRRFWCKRLPNGTWMLHPRDRESCNPPLKRVLNSANDPVITHEDIICKLQAAGRDWNRKAVTDRMRIPTETHIVTSHRNNTATQIQIVLNPSEELIYCLHWVQNLWGETHDGDYWRLLLTNVYSLN